MKPIPTQEYLKTNKVKDLPQEVKDEIKRVRDSYDFMPWDMFEELFKQRLIKRTIKLKHPRSLWVCEEGKIWFFNFYYKSFNFCGFFHTEEFLAERNKKETEERELIEQRKAEKKRAKQALKEVPVKQKRKRITKKFAQVNN